MYSLRELGYPTLEEVKLLGLTGKEFVDICRWLQKGKKRFGDGWLRRAYPIPGWEVVEFIKSIGS